MNNKKSHISKVLIGLCGVIMFSLTSVYANNRLFTYTYESDVLPAGAKEIELWTTYREGRDTFYSRYDNRVEFELGLTNHLMTAFYLNWRTISQENSKTSAIDTTLKFQGISSEWKYKMTDSVAHWIGSALYAELSAQTDEVKLEGKIILDKKIGNNLVAYNFVAEPEWEREATGSGWSTPEVEIVNTIGLTHLFSNKFSAGVEAINHSEIKNGIAEHSALFFGPVVSCSNKDWWTTLTILTQLRALKPSINEPDKKFVTDEHERFNLRMLLSFHF